MDQRQKRALVTVLGASCRDTFYKQWYMWRILCTLGKCTQSSRKIHAILYVQFIINRSEISSLNILRFLYLGIEKRKQKAYKIFVMLKMPSLSLNCCHRSRRRTLLPRLSLSCCHRSRPRTLPPRLSLNWGPYREWDSAFLSQLFMLKFWSTPHEIPVFLSKMPGVTYPYPLPHLLFRRTA